MAERNLLFTWKIESFDEIAEQTNLLELRREFEMRRHLLSGSLLIWGKVGVAGSYLLADFGEKKIYHIDRRNDPEMEVSEVSWNPENLQTRFYDQPYGTPEGFVDWLQLLTPPESDLENLKRTDLSERKLDLEMAHGKLLATYELLRKVLTSPREWLIDLSENNVQQIRGCLEEWNKIGEAIHGINLSTSRERHTEVLEQIFQFCDEVKQQLGQSVSYLRSKKSEELVPQTVKQLESQVNAIVEDTLDSFKTTNDLSQESIKQDVAQMQEGLDQLTIKVENELAQESVSEFKEIFAEQAKRHQRAAWGWLGTVGILIIGVVAGIFFYGLFDVLKLEGTDWTVVLQNILKKGTVLTLFYFALNRSIKNYTAQKHLEIVNRHRENSLGTFTRFVSEAKESRETRDAVLLAATNAIFDANQSGYLSAKAKGSDSANPIQQVMRTVFPGSSTKSED